MAKYDDQLARMNYLMEFRNEPKAAKSNIEYHANGADGKVYGILKEGTKYYIKTTESGKENIAESYEYINGFVNRRENEFKSYNDATKHLELKLMSLNEAYGKKSDVSTVDFKRSEKTFATLTEEARRELDRMNQIYENSCKIGRDCNCDPESKGTAKPEQTEENNEPFSEKVTPDMDYSGSKGTVEGATEGKKVSGVDADLKSDKKKTANSGSEKDFKDAHDDLDGESVADKKPKGGKVVRVAESIEEDVFGEKDDNPFDTPELDNAPEGLGGEAPLDEPALDTPEELGDENLDGEDINTDDFTNAELGDENALVGEPEEDLDTLLEEFMKEEDAITGPNKVLDKQGNPINGTNNGVDGETSEDWKRVGDKVNIKEEGGYGETDKSEETDTMDNYKFGFNKEKKLPAQSWDHMKLNESKVNALVENIYNKLVRGQKPESLQEAINRIVKEEVTRLNVWGKHPKYGKEPMTHPEAKEVLAGTADRDFNDDSAKGSEQYGKKIGDGKPFDQATIDNLTDQVLAKIKGALK